MFLTIKMIKLHFNESTFQPRPPPVPSRQGEHRVEVMMAGLSLGMVIEGGRDTMQKVSTGHDDDFSKTLFSPPLLL